MHFGQTYYAVANSMERPSLVIPVSGPQLHLRKLGAMPVLTFIQFAQHVPSSNAHRGGVARSAG